MEKIITHSILVLCMLISATFAQAQTYWNGTADTIFAGSGTESDPYLITTAEELAGLATRVNNKEQKEDFAGQYFKLTNDIYLTDFTNPDTTKWHEWTPIGAWTDDMKGPYEHYFDTCWFRGHFDGDNHTIHNIYMGTVGEIYIPDADDPLGSDIIDLTGSCQGFFGFVNQATIKNLNLQNAGITAANYYNGGLISNAYNSTITNCHVRKSTVVAAVESNVGGLIGLLKSSIVDSCSVEEMQIKGSFVGGLITYVDSASVVRNSHATGKAFVIKRVGSGNYGGFGGGLAQHNAGLIENCYTDMEMQAIFAEGIAGFVESTGQSGIIRNCYAKGNVHDGQDCAGFVARNYGLIESCYSMGNVIIPDDYGHYPATFVTQVGVFSMYNGYVETDMPGTCINCFSTGCCITTESGSPAYITYGFLYGVESDDSRVVNCSFNKDSIAYLNNFSFKNAAALGHSKAQMQTQAFVDTLNMVAALYGLSTWEYRAGDYPVPTGVKANITDYLAGGSGTEGDPYLIETKKHLENFRNYVNLGETFKGKYIRQTADIALNAPRSQWGVQMPEQWTPIGTMIFSPFHKEQTTEEKALWYTHYFRGTYDGDFHKVENMYIDDPVGRPAGLFGVLSHDAVIKNLSVTDAYVVSPGTLSGVAILASDVDRYARNVYISQCHTSGVVGDPDNLFWLIAASAIVNGIALEGDNWILNCSSSADVYAAERPSAVTHQDGVGGTDTIGNFLFTGTLTKQCNMSYCALSVPNNQSSWVVSQNGYFDSDVLKVFKDERDHNNLGRPTAYLQSAEFTNVLNAYVDNWNATHAYKLDYWQPQEGDYPRVNPDYKPALTITFESNGGSAVAAKRVSENTHILMPAKPTKEGHIFAGWYADAAFSQVFDFDSTAVTQSMTLYAKWLEPTYDEYDYSIFNNKFATEFHITNKAQFVGFMHAVNGIDGVLTANNFKGKTVYLDCDILLNDTTDWQYWGKYTYAESWIPIGTGTLYEDPIHPFLGTFDGQGHVISGLYIDCDEETINGREEYGLFGYVGSSGETSVIRNLGIQASVADMRRNQGNVSVRTYTGLLVGLLRDGSILQCFTQGRIIVNANSYETIGGFAGKLGGFNYDAGGIVTDCYSQVDIIYNPMDINATNRGVFGSGLVDWNNGSISNSYVAGGSWQEGVAGGTISNVYFNKVLSPNTGANTGVGMITPEMHSKTTFAGFDFDSIWGRNDTINDGYPYLRCFYKEFIPDSPDEMTIVTGIELLEADSVINVVAGDSVQLHASVLPYDADEKGITWSIYGGGCASVDENGLVSTWHKVGYGSHTTTEYITATTLQGNYQKKCTVNVFHPYFMVYSDLWRPAGTTEWDSQYSYIKSVNCEYAVLFWTQQNREGLMRDISFTNSNPEVASFEIISQDTIDAQNRRGALGVLKCLKEGKTTITLIHPSGYTATLTYDVKHYNVTGVDISAPSTTIEVGDTLQLQYTSTPIYASEPPKGLSWSSSDENVLKVDANGQVVAVGVGSATVSLTTTSPALTATMQFTVEHITLSYIEIQSSDEDNTIFEGDTCTLYALFSPANTTMRDVEWSLVTSSDSVYCKLIPMGDSCKVVGLMEAGRRRIRIKVQSLDSWRSADYTLYVNKKVAVTGIQLTKSEYSLLKGDVDKTLVANLSPSNASNKNIIWSSADTSIVTVRTEEGHTDIAYLSALRVGKTTVTATTQDGGFSASCVVTVTSNTFFTVTFLNEDGAVLQTTQVREGEMPKYTGATPTKTASVEYVYTFAGWSPEFVVATEDATYTATYTESKRKYKIQFLNYDGNLLQTSQVEYGAMPEYTGNTPVRQSSAQYNYLFEAWSPEIVSVTKDANYTATFTNFIRQYTVTFLDWDGTQLSEQVVDYGSGAVAPTAPTRDGYTFIGWDKDFLNVQSDLIVTAQYKQNIVYYTVTFLDWDGTELYVEQVEEGKDAVGPTSNPTRDGYTFIGWSKPITNIQSNLTVIAQYKENIVYFIVNFLDWDGILLKSEEVEKGKSATAPDAPTRDGYTFIGWDKDFSNIQSNLTVKALYEKDENTALDSVEEEAKLRPRKEMIDGILYIIMPDGTKYTMQGKRVK